jgi:hypothetical protein
LVYIPHLAPLMICSESRSIAESPPGPPLETHFFCMSPRSRESTLHCVVLMPLHGTGISRRPRQSIALLSHSCVWYLHLGVSIYRKTPGTKTGPQITICLSERKASGSLPPQPERTAQPNLCVTRSTLKSLTQSWSQKPYGKNQNRLSECGQKDSTAHS